MVLFLKWGVLFDIKEEGIGRLEELAEVRIPRKRESILLVAIDRSKLRSDSFTSSEAEAEAEAVTATEVLVL